MFAVIGTVYGEGDGSTTFAIPNLAYRCIQGAWEEKPVGSYIAAGLPGIYGTLNGMMGYSDIGVGWAIFNNGYNLYEYSGTLKGRVYNIGFDASNSNSIYGASNTVQPPAVTMCFCIKY